LSFLSQSVFPGQPIVILLTHPKQEQVLPFHFEIFIINHYLIQPAAINFVVEIQGLLWLP
jgi:hypothetical protein